MPFTRGAREVPNQTPASTSDARKRKTEKDEAPGGRLPDGCTCPDDCDCDGQVVCGVQAGATSRYCQSPVGHTGGHVSGNHSWHDSPSTDLPPVLPDTSGWVKRVPGECLSTDRDQPTLAKLDRVAELEAVVARVEAALGNHPHCEKHPDDDVITCGWKSAVLDVQAALAGDNR